jgi:hypothetical protein
MCSVYWFHHLFGHSDLHRYITYIDVKMNVYMKTFLHCKDISV